MTNEELCIGDKIIHGFGGIGIVTAIDKSVVTVYDKGLDDGDGHCEVTFAYNEILGIPLTEEILEKNGYKAFVPFDKIKYWKSPDGRIELFNNEEMMNTDNKWSVHVDNSDMQSIGYFECTYFHELQQFLRLCKFNVNMINNMVV